jgi:hypothetical protein
MRSVLAYPRSCHGGHVVGGPQDEREGRCRACRIVSKRRYERSVKGRAAHPGYDASDKGRHRSARYEASVKGIVRRFRSDVRRGYASRERLMEELVATQRP